MSKKFEGTVSIYGKKIKRIYKVFGDSEEAVVKKAKRIVFSTKQTLAGTVVNWDCS